MTTARQLSVNPGVLIRDCISGRTVRYVPPVAYLLLAVAVFAIFGRSLGGSTGAAESDRLFTLLLIPLVAGATRVLFMRGPYNFAEHLLATVYLGAHCLLILTAALVGLAIIPQEGRGLYAAVCLGTVLLYYAWGFSTIFPRRRWLAAVIGVLGLILGAAAWFAAMMVIVRLLSR